jgi:hypothetical protein
MAGFAGVEEGAALGCVLFAGVPPVAGAVTAELFVCGVCAGGFGPKNLAQASITMMERAEAIKIRSSGRRFFP